MKTLLIITTLFLAFDSSALAGDQTPAAQQPAAPAVVQSRGSRSKSLSFDDSVVEGLNQNSKDSLEMIEKNGRKNRQHLYQKKSDFKKEIQNFPSELGYSP
jgi:hypothetical protein